MPSMDQPTGQFIYGAAGTEWTWRSEGGYSEAGFEGLLAATTDAKAHGFDPLVHYWTATVDGRTTHFRPGLTPVNQESAKRRTGT